GGLVDDVGDRRAGDVVVVGGAGEAPGVGIGAGVRVRGVERDGADGGPGLAVDAGDRRDGRRVRTAVVRGGVRGDHDRRVRLADDDRGAVGAAGVVGVAVVGGRHGVGAGVDPVAAVAEHGRAGDGAGAGHHGRAAGVGGAVVDEAAAGGDHRGAGPADDD